MSLAKQIFKAYAESMGGESKLDDLSKKSLSDLSDNLSKVFIDFLTKQEFRIVQQELPIKVESLKTTNDITKFSKSAWLYNYDSQAYIYNLLFGYEFVFIVVDKNTYQIGLFDCSPEFLERGKDKVERAVEQYSLFFETKGFDPDQYFINKTL